MPICGSPPRVWGKHLGEYRRGNGKRFTPTRVGKTRAGVLISAVPPVHPHACGENGVARRGWARHGGSPPRVWGKRSSPIIPPASRRFTPTRVGKTSLTAPSAPTCTVHPHACGENQLLYAIWQESNGSPPRVWGKPSETSLPRRRSRFTPTRVGKT